MGFRVEHPQALIDETQFGAAAAALVERGAGKVPVADYRLSARVPGDTPAAVRSRPLLRALCAGCLWPLCEPLPGALVPRHLANARHTSAALSWGVEFM